MRTLRASELEDLAARRLHHCAGWRRPDLWSTLSDRQQVLVRRVEAEALAYARLLLAARQTNAQRWRALRGGPA